MSNRILKEKQRNADKLALLIANEVVWGNRSDLVNRFIRENNIDWFRLKENIVYHDIIPFGYISLKSCFSLLPESLAVFLKDNYYANILRFQYLEQEFLRICNSFQGKGMVFAPIKGMGLFDYYENLSLRQMSDIDILINEADFSKVDELFCGLEYEKDLMGSSEEYWKKKQCAITFSKQENGFKFLIDVHWALDFKRSNRRGLPGLWGKIRKDEHNRSRVHLLSDEDAFFALALHNRRFGKTLCLKNACDVALILKKSNSKFNWDYITEESKKSGFAATVLFVLYQAKFLFSLSIPDNVFKNLGCPFWKRKLVYGFIQKNVFLSSQRDRARELYLKSHFLLYDSFYEPLAYIFNIPIEQFAKFYKLKEKSNLTNLYYHLRWIYMPLGYLMMKLVTVK